LRTASKLSPCGRMDVLSAQRVRTKSQQRAAELGTRFHRGMEEWIKTGNIPELRPAQVADWLAGLTTSWVPPPGVECEVAVGLSPEGRYVPVTETEPHVYVPNDPSHVLLTAGRIDLMWESDGVLLIADAKTGRTDLGDPERLPQLMALGLAAADRNKADYIALGLYLAREAQWKWSDAIAMDSEQAAGMWETVLEYARLDDSARPGPWCHSICWETACEHHPRHEDAA